MKKIYARIHNIYPVKNKKGEPKKDKHGNLLKKYRADITAFYVENETIIREEGYMSRGGLCNRADHHITSMHSISQAQYREYIRQLKEMDYIYCGQAR